jgi:uncharacterized protein involved in cysteine biosynthesis
MILIICKVGLIISNFVFFKIMIQDLIYSYINYLKAVFYVHKFKLYKYLILLLFLLILFVLPVFLFDITITSLADFIPFINAQKYAFSTISLAANVSEFLLLLVLSPLFSMVSEEVGKALTGQNYRFSPMQLFKDIIRGIKISLRNMFYQYCLILMVYIVMFLADNLTIFKILGQTLIIIITSYFYGFTLLDYAMENYRMSYKKSVTFVRQHPGLAIGLGSIYYIFISLNNLIDHPAMSKHLVIYWSAFSEALVAFLGVIAASIIMYQYKTFKNEL